MAKVRIYTTPFCPYCVRAKQLLQAKGAEFDEFDVSRDRELRQQMEADSGRRTVPQIWIGEQHVGGCDDLFALEASGQLESLL